jgi:uncharacterized protein
MASRPAIRLAAKSTKSSSGYVHLQCHVKAGASKQREGVVSVSDAIIEVCIAAQPRDGEANLSVRKVFSDVYFSAVFVESEAYFTRFSSAPSLI